MENKGLLCKLCLTYTSRDNQMRRIPTCKHELCEACLSENLPKNKGPPYPFTCPYDRQEYRFYSLDLTNMSFFEVVKQPDASSSESLPENTHQISIEGPRIENQPKYMLCQQHNEPEQLWCHEDQKMVCPKCALFNHAEHKVKKIDFGQYTAYGCSKSLLGLLERKDHLVNTLKGETLKKQAKKEFEAKKKIVVRDIKKWFMTLFQMLAETETVCFDRIDRCFKRLEQKFARKLSNNTVECSKLLDWQGGAMQLLKKFQTSKESIQKQQSDVSAIIDHIRTMQRGEIIIERLEDQCKNMDSWKMRIKDCVQVSLDSKLENLIRQIPNSVLKQAIPVESIDDVYESVKNNKSRVLTRLPSTNDELLLDGIKIEPETDRLAVNQSMFTLNESMIHSATISSFHGSPKLLNMSLNVTGLNDLQHNKSATSLAKSYNSKRSTFNSMERPHRNSTIERNPIKKLAQTNLPQKYKRMVQDLIDNKLTIVDLTHCDLDFLAISHVLSHIKEGGRVKTIKLIKCKLTDQSVLQLLKYFGTTTSINFSQNLLSDKVIQYFIREKHFMPNLRNLVVSQNSIKERMIRVKLEELGKLGVSVTV